MKKFKLNNFIAFTLSEMMIVLLIFSVLSAAMLPSIIGKKKKTMPLDDTPVTRWQGEFQTFGAYYQNGNTKVFLGGNPINLSTYSPTLILNRDTSDENLSTGLTNIRFYEKLKYVGEIASDVYRNIGIGKFLKLHHTDENVGSSLIVGNYAAYFGRYNNSVLIGTYAGKSTDFTNIDDNISLGYFAGASTTNRNDYTISIGTYAGNNEGVSLRQYGVNIGSYSGYKMAGVGTVNIGVHSGSSTSGGTSDYEVNIGKYSGSRKNGASSYTVNIFTNNELSETFNQVANVNIGYFATLASSSQNVNIAGGYNSSSSGVNLGYGAGAYAAGVENTFVGTNAGNSSKGSHNSFIGYEAGMSSIGSYNVIIGKTKGVGGSYNTVINNTGINPINTSYNTYIITKNGVSPKGNYVLAIGSGCSGIAFGSDRACISPLYSASNAMGTYWTPTSSTAYHLFIASPFGGTYTYESSTITFYSSKLYAGTSTFNVYSDKRLKENIKPVKNSLEKIRKINIYEYSMKSDKTHESKMGVLAQELKNIIPEAVSVHPNSKYYTVSADWIMFTAIDAIKDLDKIVQNLQNDVKNYIKQLLDVSKIVENLDIRLNNIAETHVVMQAKLKEIDKILSKTENK